MPDLRIETIAISALRPWKRNARTHSKKQIRQLVAALLRLGATRKKQRGTGHHDDRLPSHELVSSFARLGPSPLGFAVGGRPW